MAVEQWQEPLLDISRREDRPLIVIDGRAYYRLRPGDLGLIARERIHRLWQSYANYQNALVNLEEVADADDQLGQLTGREICSYVVEGLSDDVLHALDFVTIDAIVQGFITDVVADAQANEAIADDPGGPAPDWGEIIPALQYGYQGADPTIWLTMPTDYLMMFQKMLPRLEARESMRGAMVSAYGHANQKGRAKLDQMWRNAAQRPRGNVQYDSQGRVVLRGSKQVLQWFSHYGVRMGS